MFGFTRNTSLRSVAVMLYFLFSMATDQNLSWFDRAINYFLPRSNNLTGAVIHYTYDRVNNTYFHNVEEVHEPATTRLLHSKDLIPCFVIFDMVPNVAGNVSFLSVYQRNDAADAWREYRDPRASRMTHLQMASYVLSHYAIPLAERCPVIRRPNGLSFAPCKFEVYLENQKDYFFILRNELGLSIPEFTANAAPLSIDSSAFSANAVPCPYGTVINYPDSTSIQRVSRDRPVAPTTPPVAPTTPPVAPTTPPVAPTTPPVAPTTPPVAPTTPPVAPTTPPVAPTTPPVAPTTPPVAPTTPPVAPTTPPVAPATLPAATADSGSFFGNFFGACIDGVASFARGVKGLFISPITAPAASPPVANTPSVVNVTPVIRRTPATGPAVAIPTATFTALNATPVDPSSTVVAVPDATAPVQPAASASDSKKPEEEDSTWTTVGKILAIGSLVVGGIGLVGVIVCFACPGIFA